MIPLRKMFRPAIDDNSASLKMSDNGELQEKEEFDKGNKKEKSQIKNMLKALEFEVDIASHRRLRAFSSHLQTLLARAVTSLKEKMSLKANFESQEAAMDFHNYVLEDIVFIAKYELNARNSEFDQLQEEINNMKDNIVCDKEKFDALLDELAEANKQNEMFQKESQEMMLQLTDLKRNFDRKIADLVEENMSLSALVGGPAMESEMRQVFTDV